MVNRYRSVFWTYFEKLSPEKSKCRICKTVVKNQNNTTNLKQHLRARHPEKLAKLAKGCVAFSLRYICTRLFNMRHIFTKYQVRIRGGKFSFIQKESASLKIRMPYNQILSSYIHAQRLGELTHAINNCIQLHLCRAICVNMYFVAMKHYWGRTIDLVDIESSASLISPQLFNDI